ncbi:hypothetical protein D3C77_290060 [compost metagenome]
MADDQPGGTRGAATVNHDTVAHRSIVTKHGMQLYRTALADPVAGGQGAAFAQRLRGRRSKLDGAGQIDVIDKRAGGHVPDAGRVDFNVCRIDPAGQARAILQAQAGAAGANDVAGQLCTTIDAVKHQLAALQLSGAGPAGLASQRQSAITGLDQVARYRSIGNICAKRSVVGCRGVIGRQCRAIEPDFPTCAGQTIGNLGVAVEVEYAAIDVHIVTAGKAVSHIGAQRSAIDGSAAGIGVDGRQHQ